MNATTTYSDTQILSAGKRTIAEESEAIRHLSDLLDEGFVRCVRAILAMSGRLIVTGIGKSASIAGKMVATFNSTGTSAMFMHAADAIHGDLGMIRKEDIIICLSKSGNTPEIKVLLPLLRGRGNLLVGITGNPTSYLALQADIVLDTSVKKEACPNNLAPTSSTTAQLVMGDALAVALLECRGFTTADFARVHPGGALGKRLYLRVADLYPANEKPAVKESTPLAEVIIEISARRLGCTAVLTAGGSVSGIITDGDLRRMLHRKMDFERVTAADIMSKTPKTIESSSLVSEALEIMNQRSITQLLVVDNDQYLGVIHLHDILKEGII
ncbi:MAG: KpsF/GutQ family sugar-phosphate isomerase [Bacteroidales bacterium]|nr:KpsF/GutQ family sugar-phosphate isomerase [Bacteroidales bacterium]